MKTQSGKQESRKELRKQVPGTVNCARRSVGGLALSKGEGRVRVSWITRVENFHDLANAGCNPSPSSSPLREGERRQADSTEASL